MPERNIVQEKIDKSRLLVVVSILAGSGSLALAVLILVLGVSSDWAGLDLFSLSIIPFIIAFLFALASMVYGILAGKAAHEKEEKELLVQRKKNTSAFDINEDVRFTSEKSLQNYQKYAPYVLACLGAIISGVVLFLFWYYWKTRPASFSATPSNALNLAFVSAIFMFVSAFAGAFCIGQSYDRDFRWLRPVGAWLIVGFLMTLCSMIAAMMFRFNYPGTDAVLTDIAFVLLVILSIEFIIDFVIEFYRPRTLEEPRPVFESRLLALFTEPGGLIRNIADTLDYQFGFKVSKTWIYSFVEKSIFPLVIMWLITLWLFTCIAEVSPNEIGIRERFGRVVSTQSLPPGIHFKFPWPFGKISRYQVDLIHEIVIGPEMKDKNGKEVKPKVILWTKNHYAKESRFLVATEKSDASKQEVPVAFVGVSIPIQYKINKEKIIDYAYRHNDSPKFLKNIAEQVVTQYFASVDLLKVMSIDRGKTVFDLKKKLQDAIDKAELGIDIVYVNFHDAHPPVKEVAPAFEDVIGAMEEKETMVLNAEAERNRILPAAEAKASRINFEAKAYRQNTIEVAKAESDRFYKQLKAYRQMPSMFRLKTYLDFLENDCSEIRKYIISASIPYEVYEINLEEKTRLDLLDADLSELTK